MRVCLILEGCYPYIRGGVSSWAHEYILSNPDIEFSLWTIHSARKYTGKQLYELPSNVVEMNEIYLEDASNCNGGLALDPSEISEYIKAIREFVDGENPDWENIFKVVARTNLNIASITKSEEFLDFAISVAKNSNGKIGLSEAYYGLNSMLLPLSYLLTRDVPQADIYHSAVAGYGGLLGAMAKHKTGKPFVLTEHGIYPREREEELIQADWVAVSMRDKWISSFYNLSKCAYHYADKVTALFSTASAKQIEIGCPKDKCSIVPNGIHVERFSSIPMKDSDDIIEIGAFVRFAAIKDIKTLIYSFYNLKKTVSNAHLYIMGGTDDELYKQECIELIQRLHMADISIEGHINTVDYMKKMDFTVMSSISEGQPLAILESLAAGRPCVATNVGNCAELLSEPSDNYGVAGICCTPMDSKGIADAMVTLCLDDELRKTYGNNGRNRVLSLYTHEIMNKRYLEIYNEVL